MGYVLTFHRPDIGAGVMLRVAVHDDAVRFRFEGDFLSFYVTARVEGTPIYSFNLESLACVEWRGEAAESVDVPDLTARGTWPTGESFEITLRASDYFQERGFVVFRALPEKGSLQLAAVRSSYVEYISRGEA